MRTFDISKDYSREDFAEFLRDFLPDDFESHEEEVYFDFTNIKKGFALGTCKSLDLDILEFSTKSGHDPRVTLTREVVSCMKKYGYSPNVLAVFHSERSHNWRLSLITTEYSIEDGKVKTEHSNPRRFSFMLGEGCKAHTPETMLFNQGTVSSRDDLKSRFDIEVVTKEFYSNLFIWYNWACENVTFPTGSTEKDAEGKREVHQTDKNNSLNLIRLITRLMFVWFIKQKDLIPQWIFDKEELGKILSEFNPESKTDGNYYNAVLQNLFFATLNKKIEERAFADDKKDSYNKQFGVKNFYRDNAKKSFFKESNQKIIERFRPVPFLNGGLFECLDKLDDDKDGMKNIQEFTDGFSREPEWMAFVPNMLFWQEDDGEHEGLIHLLNRYNFTVDENSPSDVQVALDPELLGKVFENLLGTYNPETSETARKSSGSFYTPRQIVSFMVDEAIKAYLSKAVKSISAEELNTLFDDGTDVFGAANKEEIVSALKKLKILDPACGSGAFPMGALQRIVHLIQKCGGVEDDRASLYALKLSLIENCLYGADIQPIAVQICKLRFFISLICEQEKAGDEKDNYGIPPLPNLETKFVAANSLIGLERNEETELFSDPDGKIAEKKAEIQGKRHEHFNAPTAELKAKCRAEDKKLREELMVLLEKNKTFAPKDANQLADWNPYDQNAVSGFFDAEWMFNVSDGFDIVIGNPPYVKEYTNKSVFDGFREHSPYYMGKMDLWYGFACNGIDLLKEKGILCFIAQNNWTTSSGAKLMRKKIIKDSKIRQLLDFNTYMVFESADIQTMIMLFERNSTDDGYTFEYRTLLADAQNADMLALLGRQPTQKTKYLSPKIIRSNYANRLLTFSENDSLFEKMTRNAEYLNDNDLAQGIVPNPDVVNVRNIKNIPAQKINKEHIKIGDGVFVVRKGHFDKLNSTEKKYIKPLFEPKDLERYYVGENSEEILYITKKNYKADAPTLKKHLSKYREIMEERRENKNGRINYYNLHWPREEKFFNKGEKILSVRKCIAYPVFAYTQNEAYVMMAINVIKTSRFNLKFLTGVLNSRLIAYWLKHKGKMQGSNYQVDKEPLLSIPLPKNPLAAQQKPVITLVDKILAAKKQDPAADTSALEAQIDGLVYTLYGLTADEIAVVEGR